MALLIGALLAAGVAVFAAAVGYDRSRAFYPTVLTVIASYYVLFAVLAGKPDALVREIPVFAAFAGLAVLGFRTGAWITAAGLAAHAALDIAHPALLGDAGAPAWWPDFCLAYDLVAAAGLAANIPLAAAGRAWRGKGRPRT